MLLLLPLFVRDLGGSEAAFGVVLSSAAVPTLVLLVLLSRAPRAFRPHWLLGAAIAVFGLGAAGTTVVSESWQPLVAIGLLVGTAWALVYTLAPMVMDEMVSETGRVTHFGYLTGVQQIGIGLGPVFGGWLSHTTLGLRGTFAVAGAVCAVAAACALLAGALTPDARRAERPDAGKVPVGLLRAWHDIFRSPVGPWLCVIALFACLFTAMTQFQTTYADRQGLSYSTFYIAYTVAVIFVRFLVAPRVSRFGETLVIAASLSVMLAAVASFLAVGANPVAYAASSAALGLGYGLALPATQARAVSVSPAAVRDRVLPTAGLVFQAAILLFPLVVGWLIVQFGYPTLFAVLIVLAVVQAAIAWRRVVGERADAAKVRGAG
jgi:MFS family permease